MHRKIYISTPNNAVIPIINIVGHHCNLRCAYCFHSDSDQSRKTVLSDNLLSNFIQQYIEMFSTESFVRFIWHGGEPLLAGLDKFNYVIECQNKYLGNRKVSNAIQTNGTLINQSWGQFFKEHYFKVGISIDGPEHIHNMARKFPDGKGSFSATCKGIEVLKESGINFGTIVTVTKYNFNKAKIILDFIAYEVQAKSVGFNFYSSIDKKSRHSISISYNEAYLFLVDAYEWFIANPDSNLEIRELKDFTAAIFGRIGISCNRNGTCGDYISLNYDGSVSACTRLADVWDKAFFGNLKDNNLIDILSSNRRLEFLKVINSSVNNCRECKFFKVCRNGCTYQRIPFGIGKYNYCNTIRQFLKFLSHKLKLIADNNELIHFESKMKIL
ncbi:MAG: radical SAM protein [Thermodesulfovibrio sp.]|nr:radical SAM protein [Thermodesulfovibrio sp.]